MSVASDIKTVLVSVGTRLPQRWQGAYSRFVRWIWPGFPAA